MVTNKSLSLYGPTVLREFYYISTKSIAQKLHISESTVRNVASFLRLSKRENRDLVHSNFSNVNARFFDTWTPESAYVFGFFLADGCLIDLNSKKGISAHITFVNKDREILEAIARVMKSEYLVREIKRPDGIRHYLQISNYHLVGSLKKLGCESAKSCKKIALPQVPTELFNHFVRGYIDGDGCITTRRLIVLATKESEILPQLIKRIKEIGLPSPKIYEYKLTGNRTHVVERADWMSLSHRIAVRDWLYKEANIFLKRKREIAYGWDESN